MIFRWCNEEWCSLSIVVAAASLAHLAAAAAALLHFVVVFFFFPIMSRAPAAVPASWLLSLLQQLPVIAAVVAISCFSLVCLLFSSLAGQSGSSAGLVFFFFFSHMPFFWSFWFFVVVLGVLPCCLRLPASFRAFFPARDLYLVRLSVASCAELADNLVWLPWCWILPESSAGFPVEWILFIFVWIVDIVHYHTVNADERRAAQEKSEGQGESLKFGPGILCCGETILCCPLCATSLVSRLTVCNK